VRARHNFFGIEAAFHGPPVPDSGHGRGGIDKHSIKIKEQGRT
jgi:hypothetical protein